MSSPNGIRTRVSTLRGWCPWPLDDGAGHPFGPSQPIRSSEIPVRPATGQKTARTPAAVDESRARSASEWGSTDLGAHAPSLTSSAPAVPRTHDGGTRRGTKLGGEDSNPQ